MRSKHAQGNPQGNQINRHAIQVGVVDVGLYCNALAREARFRKMVPESPDLRSISQSAGVAQIPPEFDGQNRGNLNAKKTLAGNHVLFGNPGISNAIQVQIHRRPSQPALSASLPPQMY